MIRSGALGRIDSFDLREGRVLNWPMASDFFSKERLWRCAGEIDIGVHVLDQILWWLGDADSFEYYDDNYGGVEADCEVHLKLKSGVQGIVDLRRPEDFVTRRSFVVSTENWEVSLTSNHVAWRFKNAALRGVVGHADKVVHEPIDSQDVSTNEFAAEHDDFIRAIREGCPPMVCGLEGKKSMALIESCSHAEAAVESSLDGRPAHIRRGARAMTLEGKRVLVTGGTGAIGGRVVEKLILEHRARVRVLVRSFKHASRIARFPLEMVGGDLTDRDAVCNTDFRMRSCHSHCL